MEGDEDESDGLSETCLKGKEKISEKKAKELRAWPGRKDIVQFKDPFHFL
jgi:hypothetical protein